MMSIAPNVALLRLLTAITAATVALLLYGQQKTVADDVALGEESTHRHEEYLGKTYTASSVRAMISVLTSRASNAEPCSDSRRKDILWLGNSQLHTINQYQEGDHLAPHWLRHLSVLPECFAPLGFSLPNANYQEMMVVAYYSTKSLPIRSALISLVFDDLREDDLRDDVGRMLNADVRASLAATLIGREILSRADHMKIAAGGIVEENIGLEGFVQKELEDYLTDWLGEIFPLWAERPSLRARLMTDLYYLRNSTLGIKATSVRKMIAARYARNMAALEALIMTLREQSVPVILYFAPIRQDLPLPYDSVEYFHWKREIAGLAQRNNVMLLNLEALVPDDQWGTYHKYDVDFMHFRGEGHHLLADALAPAVRTSIGEF